MSLSYIRSLLITDPIIILATIIMGSISLLTSLFDSDGRIQHQISRVWSRMLLKVVGGLNHGGNDVLMLRLVPATQGSQVRTAHGVLHLPGLRLEIAAARSG